MEPHSRPPRRIRTLAEAHDLVAAWKASGLNQEAWCRSQGFLRSALLSWLSCVEAHGSIAEPARFIELRPVAEVPAPTTATATATALPRYTPGSDTRKAIDYILDRWAAFTAYTAMIDEAASGLSSKSPLTRATSSRRGVIRRAHLRSSAPISLSLQGRCMFVTFYQQSCYKIDDQE